MNFNKYFAFLAFLVLCLLGQQATEAHFLGKVGHKLDRAAKHVDKVADHIDTAKKVVEAGSVIAGVVASA
uniref:Cecropin A-like 10 n=1 Tax=Musca domestica TaxID=7370 RepID=A0A1I8NKH7_MUSDO|nr:cecropin A-like 10 [Musca domestica]